MERLRHIAGYLAGIELWPVAFFIAASMAWPWLLPIALGVAGIFWPIRWLAHRRLSLRTPIDWPNGLLLFMGLVSLAITSLPQITQVQVMRLFSGMALFYAIVNWTTSSKRLRMLGFGAVLTGLGLCLIAPFSVQWAVGKIPFFPEEIYENFLMLVSDYVHPNVLAGSLVIIFPLVLGWLLFDWSESRWLVRIILVFTAVFMLAILAITESRGAIMAVGAVIMLMVVLRWRWGWVLALVAVIGLALLVNEIGSQTVIDMLASGATIGGIDGRLEIWSRAKFMIQDFPFTGVGMGSFGPVADALYPFFTYTKESIPHAHNLFLQVAVDLGLPGLIAWSVILITVTFTAWKIFRTGLKNKSNWATALGVGLLCSQVALVVQGSFDAVTWGMVRTAPIVWGIWGICFAAKILDQ